MKTATSTDPDGTYRIMLCQSAPTSSPPNSPASRRSRGRSPSAEPRAIRRSIFQLALAPRVPIAPTAAAGIGGARRDAAAGRRGIAGPARSVRWRSRPAAAGAQRFETLAVQTQAAAAAGLEATPTRADAARAAPAARLLDRGPTQAVSINGNMASLDRGMMNDRLDAIGRGEFDPATGEFAQGFGPGGPGGDGRRFGGPGGRGGPAAGRTRRPGRTGGRGGPGGFVLGGRGGRQNAYNASVELHLRRLRRSTARRTSCVQDSPAQQKPYTRQTFGGHASAARSGFLACYNGTRRTNFMADLQRARAAAICSISTPPCRPRRCAPATSRRPASPLIDPATGLPFAGNQIPAGLA